MVYEPVQQDSPYTARRYLQADSNNIEGIRTVQYDGHGTYDDRPPSFHSDDHGQHPRGHHVSFDNTASHGQITQQLATSRAGFRVRDVHDDVEDDDGYNDARLQRPDYQARSEADLELRLNAAYLDDARRVVIHTPMRDDGHESGDDHFEDSFEGDQEWPNYDEKRRYDNEEQLGEAGGLESPALSFAGGFGAPPPTAHLRRNITNRRVKLTKGNLILDCAVPTRLAGFLPRKGDDEFMLTRYTAVTCGPEDFNRRNYTLRPSIYNRQTELLVVVTL